MPFKNDKQRRWGYANHPEAAKKWDSGKETIPSDWDEEKAKKYARRKAIELLNNKGVEVVNGCDNYVLKALDESEDGVEIDFVKDGDESLDDKSLDEMVEDAWNGSNDKSHLLDTIGVEYQNDDGDDNIDNEEYEDLPSEVKYALKKFFKEMIGDARGFDNDYEKGISGQEDELDLDQANEIYTNAKKEYDRAKKEYRRTSDR